MRDGDGESGSDSDGESDGDAEPGDSADVVNPGDDDGDAEPGDDGDVERLVNDNGDGDAEPGDEGDDEPDGDAESDDGHVYSGGVEGDGEGSASAIPPLVGWLLGSDAVAAAGEGEP